MAAANVAPVSRLDSETVRRASAAWVWLPAGSRHVDTDYRLIDYPTWTGVGCQVTAIDSDRPAGVIVDEALERARTWDRTKLGWWVTESTRPAALVNTLRSRGAEDVLDLDVLALELADGVPDLGPTPGITTERVLTRQQHLDADQVNVAVWNHEPISAERLQEQVDADFDAADIRVLARLDGEPVATGGCTVVDGVARLWGAATIEPARGRGGYRAVLRLRMQLAREIGATLALVKGQVKTSAPILKRVGFAEHGRERLFQLPVID